MLESPTDKPTDGKAYHWTTKDRWVFSCIPAKNRTAPSEGFLGVAPDGTKYFFDWLVNYGSVPGITKPAEGGGTTGIARAQWWMLPTRIEDAQGNYVTYAYTNARLDTISASDGRSITLSYSATDGKLVSATDGTRTWTYQRFLTAGVQYKTGEYRVTYPDGSVWKSVLTGNLQRWGGTQCRQTTLSQVYSGANSLQITLPSGAVGTFNFQQVVRGTSWVPYNGYAGSDNCSFSPRYSYGVGLTSKQIQGPGLPLMSWTLTFGPLNDCYQHTGGLAPSNPCTASSPTTTWTELRGPDGLFKSYVFGNRYRTNEGDLLQENVGTSASAVLRSTAKEWIRFNAIGQPNPLNMQYGQASFDAKPKVQKRSTVVQNGVTFDSNTTLFDSRNRASAMSEASSLGMTRNRTVEYYDLPTKWILGQPARTTVGGVEESRTVFDGQSGLPVSTYKFGALDRTMAYRADGSLSWTKDGRNLQTTFGAWYRGIPSSITFADNSSVAFVVDPLGRITKVTNEVGAQTSYGYDPMGRLQSVTYPTSCSVSAQCSASPSWTPTTFSFTQVGASEFGIPAGHWRQTITTGSSVQTKYFDAFWRPLVEKVVDSANPSASTSYVISRFDSRGNTTFSSYPVRAVTAYTDVVLGTQNVFDVLDRATRVQQDSELGVLATVTSYEPGFQVKVIDPEGAVTLTGFYAWNEPIYEFPKTVLAPEDSRTDIARDSWGKPLSISKRNGSGTTWNGQYFVYDANQRVCKKLLPETGTTRYAYDAAGNIAWVASGLPWSGTAAGTCSDVSATGRMVTYTYDVRNRISAIAFPDGRGNQTWAYWGDGKPRQVITDNDGVGVKQVANTYNYNNRRMLTSEVLQQPGWYQWSLAYAYNASGHLASTSYPTGLVVDYAPNALGQPTKAGTFASGVKYAPDGSISEFTYGNGIVHSTTKNARQLPSRSLDSYGATRFLDDSVQFDKNGSISSIVDALPGGRGNRAMLYDDLGRLTSVTSPMFGTATYSYDAIDNVISTNIGGVFPRNHRFCYDGSNRLTNVKLNDCTSGTSVIGMGYDTQGNLTNRNGMVLDFDFGNRLRKSIGAESYIYDANGRRAESRKQDGRVHLWFYGQSGQLLFGQTQSGAVLNTEEYVYLGGSVIAEVDHDWPSNVITATRYVHTDALGSPVVETDGNRNVLKHYEYEPYGQALSSMSRDELGYSGHVADVDTHLQYMQQRFYDYAVGRFISVDPIGINESNGNNFNRYWYAVNNPYTYVDLDGRGNSYTLGVHVSTTTDRSKNTGHAWISLQRVGDTRVTTYALWQDGHTPDGGRGVPIENNGNESDVRFNEEARNGYARATNSAYFVLDEAQMVQFEMFVAFTPGDYDVVSNNCTDFVVDVVAATTGITLDATALGEFVSNPAALSNMLDGLNNQLSDVKVQGVDGKEHEAVSTTKQKEIVADIEKEKKK